jgi:predicted dehydrogenase
MSPERARRLDVRPLISHRFAIDDAEAAYAVVTGGEAHLGVVLGYSSGAPETKRPAPAATAQVRAAPAKGICAVALIGAGYFARGVLMPELVKLKGVRLETVVTRRGAGAEAARETFGFAHADTDPETVFASPQVNAVIIATHHDSHAALVERALRAGKAVLVEKPLGLDRTEIEGVRAASAESNAFFQVGFNRRFAPLAREMHGHLERLSGPKFLLLRVNAGPVPNESWVADAAEGGGRILGEVCHFVDLARYLTGAAILSVGAEAARPPTDACADVNVSLGFADGSLATIAYTALGDASRDKELIEVYGGGSVARIEDFRTLAITAGGRVTTRKAGRAPDKGIRAELRAFVDAVAGGGPAPIDESELVETSLATVAVMESLRTGARVTL